MSDIYTMLRSIIGDSTSPYDIADLNLLKYLDAAIDRLSLVAGTRVVEDIVISSSDINLGYKDLSNDCARVKEIDLYDDTYQIDGSRITFFDEDLIAPGTYRVEYTKKYKKFDGSLRDNSYFDYPRPEADLAIVFYALSLYIFENGAIKADGTLNLVTSKSEEGMSVSYGTGGGIVDKIGTPGALQMEALKMMRDLPKAGRLFYSVQG